MQDRPHPSSLLPAELLGSRSALPADLTWLVHQYPREVWPRHPNLNDLAQFWLQRHAMFRELGRMLDGGIAAFRENDQRPMEFAGWLAPRIRFFLAELEGHHTVEDDHYFPIFKRADVRLARGFDLLDSDHHIIHDALERNAEVAKDFFARLSSPQDARRAADLYADENERLVALLARHLDDEEDLVVPMILDRGGGLFG